MKKLKVTCEKVKDETNTYNISFDLAAPLAEKLQCSKDQAAELLAVAFMKFLGVL